MKYQYFIASRWRNKDQVLELTEKLRGNGKSVYCFLEAPHAVHRIKNDSVEDMKNLEKKTGKVIGIIITQIRGKIN